MLKEFSDPKNLLKVPEAKINYEYCEFGCSPPIRFKTSEGWKTMQPAKNYDENLDEIK